MKDNSLLNAIKLHKEGDLLGALRAYESILDNRPSVPAALNASSILRKNGSYDASKKILVNQLIHTPNESGLWHNLARTEVDLGDLPSSFRSIVRSLSLSQSSLDAWLCAISILKLFKLHSLALYQLRYVLLLPISNESDVQLKLHCLALDIISSAIESGHAWQVSYEKLLKSLSGLSSSRRISDYERASLLSYLIEHNMLLNNLDEAQVLFRELSSTVSSDSIAGNITPDKILPIYHNSGWNLSIHLIKSARFAEGWRLYDHGLRVPATGPQRWQRALRKPFTYKQVPLWQGESLSDSSILVISEQAVGDSIMFLRLLSFLQMECPAISLYVNPRLAPLYKRATSLPVFSVEDELPAYNNFDFQIPVGSILQYRLDLLPRISSDGLILKPDKSKSELLAAQIKRRSRFLVGFSWMGGGIPKRKQIKSVDFTSFSKFFQLPECDFVSLQYGNIADTINNYNQNHRHKQLHYLPSVNPLQDMDTWLSLVSLCDFVITVANTTVHGAASLQIPTYTLVPISSDWRWLDPHISTDSYWYNSVHAFHQDSNSSWDTAINSAYSKIYQHIKQQSLS
jgi:hypothetical protein